MVARVYISYASVDVAYADQIRDWLRADGHDLFLDRDVGGGVRVAEDWEQRLYGDLRRADVVLCVVSGAFVASTWCSAEVAVALVLGCRLLPLQVEADVVHPLMRQLQHAYYQDDPAVARERVLWVLRSVDAAGWAGWREGSNPYPGLMPFSAELAGMFFGRSYEVRELAGRLRAPTGPGSGAILAVVGPSGCGKSSLLSAGLLPLLGADPGWVVVEPWLPGDDPVAALARAMTLTANRLELGWSSAEVRAAFDHDDGLSRLADELVLAQPGRREARRLLIAVDQAEELFSRTAATGRAQLARLLREAVAGSVRVVATVRSEFLDDLRELPALAEVPIVSYLLAPLARDFLHLVIEEPARRAGLRLEPELVARLVADTGSGEALPLLAFTLYQLADGLSRGAALSPARYEELGGVRGALARHADVALRDAVQGSGLSVEQILAGLVRLVSLDGAGRRTRRRTAWDDLPEPLLAALRAFVERRLLTTASDDGSTWVEVAHEALLTAWPPLDVAIADRTVALHTVRSVEQAAAEWRAGDSADMFLWNADRLAATLSTLGLPSAIDGSTRLAVAPVVDLSPDALAFLDATRSAHRRGRRDRRRREKERALEEEIRTLRARLDELVEFDLRSDRDGGVFISYSHADRDLVGKITGRFDRDGINYWMDDKELRIGQMLDQAISEGIEKSWLFLVILTPTSIESRWVKRELDEAVYQETEGKKVILPVIAKGLDPSRIPGRLQPKIYIDLDAGFDRAYDKLVRSIQEHILAIGRHF